MPLASNVLGFSSEELATRVLTKPDLANLVQGDVRLTAAVILRALDPAV